METIDGIVGQKIRTRRTNLGMSQVELGKAIGVRFQQVQKYESGVNRVSASRLWMIAKALDVHISHFFDESLHMDNALTEPYERPQNSAVFRDDQDTLELVKRFTDLSAEQKHAVLTIIKNMSVCSHASKIDIQG